MRATSQGVLRQEYRQGNVAGDSKPAQLQIAARHNPWLAASLSSHVSSAVCQWDPQTACTHDLTVNKLLTLLSDKRGWLVANMMVRMQSGGDLSCCAFVVEIVHGWSHQKVLMVTMLPINELFMHSQNILDRQNTVTLTVTSTALHLSAMT